MDTLKRCRLQKHREAIILDLDVKEVDNYLVAADILTEEDVQKISSESSSKDRARHLLDILPSKGPLAFDAFVGSLKTSYPWLSERLTAPWSRASWVSKEEEQSFSDALLLGGLPTAPPHNVDRAGKLQDVQAALKSLERGNYVVLHGMAGSGKSCLAARALTDKNLLIDTFKGCVYWFSVGDVIPEDLLTPVRQLLSTVCALSQSLREVPTTVKDAKIMLRKVMMSEPMRDGLLILDDVTSSNVIDAFDIGCKTLVTTKDTSCMKKVKGRECCIKINEGFTEKESLSLFAQCVDLPVAQLPHQATKIHHLCKGVPIVIALIGAQLAENKEDVRQNPGRWDHYLDKLTNRDYKEICLDNDELSQDGLLVAIGMSIDSLPAKLREMYQDFALFVEDVNIKPEVLQTLWGINKYKVEDMMGEFLKKSLAVCKWNEHLNSYVYGIHDVLLYYLRQQMTDEEKKALHKKLLDRYRKVCGGRLCDLPTNDNYIFSYLGYHLSQAHEWHTFKSLYFDLEFLEAKLKVSGLGDLLVDFRKYRDLITGQIASVNEILEDFEKFVQCNGLNLFRYPDLDIVQCGLQQPRRSHVYKEALRIASERTSKLYFELMLDHESGTQPLTLPAKQEVLAACFSDDSNRILAANGKGLIHLWDMDYGRILYTFFGHTAQVVHLELNPDGRQFLSVSEDGSVKLWSLENIVCLDRSSQIYDQHGCALKTPSPRMRQDSWSNMFGNGDANADKSFRTLAHGASVRHATFSHDGFQLVSCAESVKVWNCATGNCVLEISNRDDAATCTFSSDDTLVMFAVDGVVYIHSSSNGEFVSSLHNPGLVIRILPIPDCDSHLVVTCSNSVLLWSMEELASRELCRSDGGNYICSVLSPDGEHVIVTGTDNKIAVWEIAGTRSKVQEYENHSGLVHVLDTYWSNTGQVVLSGSDDRTIKVWLLTPQRPPIRLNSKFHAVWPDNKSEFPLLAAPDTNKNLQVLNSRKVLVETAQENCPVSCCCLTPDGNLVAYGCEDGSVKVLTTDRPSSPDRSPDINGARDLGAEPREARAILKLNGAVRFLKFLDFCGVNSIVAASESRMEVWSESRGVFITTTLNSLVQCFPTDLGKKLITCAQDSCIRLWGVDTCTLVVGGVASCHVTSADRAGHLVAMVDTSGKLFLVVLSGDNSSPANMRSYLLDESPLRCCRFSQDAKLLAAGHDSGVITVWEVNSREILARLKAHKTWVRDLAFSPWAPSVLVSVGDLVAFWDIGEVLRTRRRRRSGTHFRLSIELPSNSTENVWCTKHGAASKRELLGSVKLVGSHAQRIQPSPDFNVFTTVDTAGRVYYLKVFSGLQLRKHKFSFREKTLKCQEPT